MKQRAIEVIKNAAIILAVGIAYYIFYSLTGIGLKCPLFELTGLLCPGCGMSRMFVSIFTFDFSSAFYYNAALLILLPFFIGVTISYYYGYIKYGNTKVTKSQGAILIVCIILLLIFGVLRNIFNLGLMPSFDGALLNELFGGT